MEKTPLQVDKSYWTHPSGAPRLFLAPMEGIGDRSFRRAISSIGGFDEACTSFIRIPRTGQIKGLAKGYNPNEIAPIPQAVQLMGQHPEALAALCQELALKGAPRVDLNCGCPSNTVTGHGAGSSILKEPKLLYALTKAMSSSVTIPVSVKIRSGFDDTTLFRENLRAVQEGGAAFLTLHPRTKVEGYTPPAHWDLISEAKSLLSIPVVGNGDIRTVADAKRMLAETKCDALMIGRGAVVNPWIFHEIKADFKREPNPRNHVLTQQFMRKYLLEMQNEDVQERTQINKLKQLLNYLFQGNETLLALKSTLLRQPPQPPNQFLEMIIENYTF